MAANVSGQNIYAPIFKLEVFLLAPSRFGLLVLRSLCNIKEFYTFLS